LRIRGLEITAAAIYVCDAHGPFFSAQITSSTARFDRDRSLLDNFYVCNDFGGDGSGCLQAKLFRSREKAVRPPESESYGVYKEPYTRIDFLSNFSAWLLKCLVVGYSRDTGFVVGTLHTDSPHDRQTLLNIFKNA
jgi:hypothetical protein